MFKNQNYLPSVDILVSYCLLKPIFGHHNIGKLQVYKFDFYEFLIRCNMEEVIRFGLKTGNDFIIDMNCHIFLNLFFKMVNKSAEV